MLNYIWLIPLLPALGALTQLLVGRRLSNKAVSAVSVGLPGLSFLWALGCFFEFVKLPSDVHVFSKVIYSWLPAGTFRLANGSLGNFNVNVGFHLDPLSTVMLLVVTGVGFLIHVYSIGYMAHEGGYYRFFGYMNLFMFSMLILVLANNYLMMFVGWEGVGLCSYLLIGFYFLRKSASDAGKKAFVVNRIGDAGFLLGVMLLAVTFGSLDFQQVNAQALSGRFPVAPIKSRMQIATITGLPTGKRPLNASAVTGWKSRLPKVTAISITPSRNPASPMRFMTNAFLPASEADLRRK